MEPGPLAGGIGLRRDEWLTALAAADAQATTNDPDVLTLRELATIFGTRRPAAQLRIDRLIAAGKAERTQKWIRREGDTRPRAVPGYRLLK